MTADLPVPSETTGDLDLPPVEENLVLPLLIRPGPLLELLQEALNIALRGLQLAKTRRLTANHAYFAARSAAIDFERGMNGSVTKSLCI